MNAHALDDILNSPILPLLAEELNDIVADEARRREEFFNTVTESEKAEFINGEVIVHSPVKRHHASASDRLFSLVADFGEFHNTGVAFHEKIMLKFTRNAYEPDIIYYAGKIDEDFDGEQMLFPAPDFIAEVLSPSTEKNDRGIKFEDYARHGVGEYWIIDPLAESVEQCILDGEAYRTVHHASGEIESTVITGFRIPVAAIFQRKEYQKAKKSILASAPE